MKTIKIDLSTELESLEILTLADLHIGDKHCDMQLVKDRIKYIAENDNVYTILNGDIMNMALRNSVSDIYSEQMTPMQQWRFACDLFEPIKDKILCISTGNHEFRTYKTDGLDIMHLMANELGLLDKYTTGSAVIFLRFGDLEVRKGKSSRQASYTILTCHGSGGGRKEGAKAVRLADMANIVDADIYIHSHTHLPMIMKEAFYRTDVRNSTIAMVDKLFVNTGATLNYGGYGETFEFKPASKDTPYIILNGKKKEMTARL